MRPILMRAEQWEDILLPQYRVNSLSTEWAREYKWIIY